MRLRSKQRRRHRHPRRPLRRFMMHCHLPCVRQHYADSDSGSDIQRDSLLDEDLQPSVVGGSWEEPQTPWDAPAPWNHPPLPTQPVIEASVDTHSTPSGTTQFHQNPLLMSEETSHQATIERVPVEEDQEVRQEEISTSQEEREEVEEDGQPVWSPEDHHGAVGGQPQQAEEGTDLSGSQLSGIRFTFNRQFHMASSHQYRLWKDHYGQHRHQTLPRRSVSESSNEEGSNNGTVPADNLTHRTGTLEILDDRDEPIPLNNCTDTDQLSPANSEPRLRSTLSLPSLSQIGNDEDYVFEQVPNCILQNHHQSFERNWTSLMAGRPDDIFAVCTNPALVRSNNNTLSSLGTLSHSAGRPTRSSSLNNLDVILDNFSMGTNSSDHSMGHQAAGTISRESPSNTFGYLFAVSNRLAGLTRQARNSENNTMESSQGTTRVPSREPVQLISLFNPDPQPTTTVTTDTMISSSTDSNTGSSRSSSAPRNVQQNWYVYDPRLLTGVGGREGARLTMETHYRGIHQQWSMPGIIAPPSYDEAITSMAPTDLPPPYPESVSTISSIGPPSDSEIVPLDLHDPPPPYQHTPPSTQPASEIMTSDQDITSLNLPATEEPPEEQPQSEALTEDRNSDSGSNEDAINEELDSILEEEEASQSGSIGDIGELGHGFFMNSDTGNTRISAFGGAMMGIGFGAARPPMRWNRGMGLDRWACTSNWVSS